MQLVQQLAPMLPCVSDILLYDEGKIIPSKTLHEEGSSKIVSPLVVNLAPLAAVSVDVSLWKKRMQLLGIKSLDQAAELFRNFLEKLDRIVLLLCIASKRILHKDTSSEPPIGTGV